jgi:hypothetical protein
MGFSTILRGEGVSGMGKMVAALTPEHERFIRKQRLFFVASAAAEGHVNVSPKGYDAFRILGPTEVAYLDLTGSGNETSAHLAGGGRLTFMFVAFDGAPLILRLYGEGRVVLPGTAEWEELAPLFPPMPGARQIIRAAIHAVKTSCGYGVPNYAYEGDRDTLHKWAQNKGEQGLKEYRDAKNAVSMDGIVTPLGMSRGNAD